MLWAKLLVFVTANALEQDLIRDKLLIADIM